MSSVRAGVLIPPSMISFQRMSYTHAILIIALLASGVGNTMVKVLAVDVWSEPKSSTAHALLEAEELYMSAPRAVMVAVVHDVSLKSQNAVVPEVVGVTEVSVLPPAE